MVPPLLMGVGPTKVGRLQGWILQGVGAILSDRAEVDGLVDMIAMTVLESHTQTREQYGAKEPGCRNCHYEVGLAKIVKKEGP
jgi:hypothetical protein